MPGLIGFTTPAGGGPTGAILRTLRDTLVRQSFHGEDELFTDGTVAASRVNNGAVPAPSQPAVREHVRVWLDGEVFAEGDTDIADGAASIATTFARGVTRSTLAAFNGGFTACVYDSARRRVHLVADRCGFRHLYYLVHDGALWWSSEVKSFCAVPGFAPRIRASAVESFFCQGYLSGDETWLEGVELLPGGTVATWDIDRATLERQAYWRYDDIPPVGEPADLDAVVDALGERFVAAVRRRCATGRIGLLLSGGLDSRAVLAAIPRDVTPLHAITFGQPRSFDVRLGRRAARIRGASHHVLPIGDDDWLVPRFAAVWWTDGQANLLEFHTIAATRHRDWFTVNVSGFVGDLVAGGSYVRPSGPSEREVMNTRCRRFTSMGIRARLPFFEMRLPFTDNDVLEYAFGLPPELRAGGFIYHRMLLRFFPEYFRWLPWQATGVPISWPPRAAGFARRVIRRVDLAARNIERRSGLQAPFKRQFVDYAAWLRREPARGVIESVLLNPARRSRAYTDAGVEDLWRRHLSGENHAGVLGRHLTFEVWLRQLFDGELRPGSGDYA